MYEFIRIQYIMGKLTAEQVRGFVGRYITTEQASEILANPSAK